MSGPVLLEGDEEKKKMLGIFRDESGKCDEWNKKLFHSSLFLLGAGAFGSVFQVSTRLYSQGKQKIAKDRYMYHPDFVRAYMNQRKMRHEQDPVKLRDSHRDDRLLDVVAVKYEILDQSHLESAASRFFLFLRREFLVMDALWQRSSRNLIGFPAVFDFGYIGDKLQYGVESKYKNVFTYLNIQGEEVKFFADTHNRNLEGVTKISYLAMELLGPSIDDFKAYYDPWYSNSELKCYFQVPTVFKIADQFLCRLLMLHRCGFVHHDLKPDNIAMGNGKAMNTLYLLDFGFTKQVANIHITEWMGSRKFISVDTFGGEKPNYAQDIESWFYVVMALLYDALPWSEDFIAPMLGENAEESVKWSKVISIKKTWWGDSRDAVTLDAFINSVDRLHKSKVPDIKTIIEQLHRKTRDLRNLMRHIDDAGTINADLANNQSQIFKGYMSIRKVLLQIFQLPQLVENSMLFDAEMQSYQAARYEKNCPQFPMSSTKFYWEWDVNHAIIIGGGSADTAGSVEQTTSELPIAAQMPKHLLDPISSNNPTKAAAAAPLNQSAIFKLVAPCVGKRRPTAIDEISYAYDSKANCLVPKLSGWRTARSKATELTHWPSQGELANFARPDRQQLDKVWRSALVPDIIN